MHIVDTATLASRSSSCITQKGWSTLYGLICHICELTVKPLLMLSKVYGMPF